jgi:purine-cytosine permease-like protein
MATTAMSINRIEDMIAGVRPTKVLNLISITLISLMIIFALKLITHLFFSPFTPMSSEITTILASCTAINIVAYLILRKHQLLLNNLAHNLG